MTPLIPDDWTDREALAVFEFIDTLREAIWCRYQIQLVERLQTERSTNPADWASSEHKCKPDEEVDF